MPDPTGNKQQKSYNEPPDYQRLDAHDLAGIGWIYIFV